MRLNLLWMLFAFWISACNPGNPAHTPAIPVQTGTKADPHIFIIMADDLGIDVAPCHSETVYMPFLQSRCASSLVFNTAYAYPSCTATRASLMTGRHSFRHGANDVAQSVKKLPLSEITLPEWISEKAPRYRKASFGKWHLADDENGGVSNPNLQGFDHYEGTPRQAGTYDYFEYDWYVNGVNEGQEVTYKTTKITNSVIEDFKENYKTSEFYYVNYVNPHLPYHAPPKALHHVSLPNGPIPEHEGRTVRDPELDPYYFAMLEALDSEINRLVTETTASSNAPIIFIFLGDNGSAQNVYQGDISGGYRAKASLYDGGIRIPMQIWSSDNQAYPVVTGKTNALVHTVDFFATILDLVRPGSELPPIRMDSQSFAPVFNNLSFPTRDYLYIEGGHERRAPFTYAAVNQSGKKLLLNETRRSSIISPGVFLEYYDTENDPGERENLLDKPCTLNFSEVNALMNYIITTRKTEKNPIGNAFDKEFYLKSLAELQSQCT